MKELRNYTEDAVRFYLDRWYPKADICQCDDCRMDVMAIMLNSLKPKYVVTEKGALFAQMDDFDPQYKADMISVMGLAVQLVKDHPKHQA
jgi:competence protein ComFB